MSAHNVNVCDITDDVKETLKKFRFTKNSSNAALILKVLCIFYHISGVIFLDLLVHTGVLDPPFPCYYINKDSNTKLVLKMNKKLYCIFFHTRIVTSPL